jgi:hypothetical protein
VSWEINLHPAVEKWFLKLAEEDSESAHRVEEVIDRLSERGPALGRPWADRIRGSRIHNLKELRPQSSGGSAIRILFVFDPTRQAILLAAGDKAGQWSEWYRTAIPLAEERYEAHLSEISGRGEDKSER